MTTRYSGNRQLKTIVSDEPAIVGSDGPSNVQTNPVIISWTCGTLAPISPTTRGTNRSGPDRQNAMVSIPTTSPHRHKRIPYDDVSHPLSGVQILRP